MTFQLVSFTMGDQERKMALPLEGLFLDAVDFPEKDLSVFLLEHIRPIASVLGTKWGWKAYCLCVLPEHPGLPRAPSTRLIYNVCFYTILQAQQVRDHVCPFHTPPPPSTICGT